MGCLRFRWIISAQVLHSRSIEITDRVEPYFILATIWPASCPMKKVHDFQILAMDPEWLSIMTCT